MEDGQYVIQKPSKPPEDVSSYRPISLLPIMSKIFERLFLTRLNPVISELNIIPNHQFGFRQRHGTIEQVHRVVDKIRLSQEKKEYCSAVFIDISQAFDKVWHEGLLYKLKLYLPHPYYEVLKSYLTERHFMIKLRNEYSPLAPIMAGVPQGSVLGPILYVLYTADLPTHTHTQIVTFADDTAILSTSPDPVIASQMLQENVNNIEQWLRKWRIKANEQKSTHITFTLRRDTCPPITINNNPVPQAESTKYLGMHLDRRLTWRSHIEAKKKKQLNIRLRGLYWLIGRHSKLSIENKILIYKTIIKPIWTYGIQLWGAAKNSNLNILQLFQNNVLRIIANAPRYVPIAVLHQDLNIKTIKQVITETSTSYQSRLIQHPNILVQDLLNEIPARRLRRFSTLDLTNRFN